MWHTRKKLLIRFLGGDDNGSLIRVASSYLTALTKLFTRQPVPLFTSAAHWSVRFFAEWCTTRGVEVRNLYEPTCAFLDGPYARPTALGSSSER